MLLQLFDQAKTDALRKALVAALQPYQDPRNRRSPPAALSEAIGGPARPGSGLLANRQASALALVQEVERGRIGAKEIGLAQVRQLAQHKDKELQRLVAKHWGRIGAATAGES